jgi:pimeloyl-ACP methyl ester carboxylesterase
LASLEQHGGTRDPRRLRPRRALTTPVDGEQTAAGAHRPGRATDDRSKERTAYSHDGFFHASPLRDRVTMRAWLQAGLLLAVFYALLLALVWWQQERLVFVPTALPADHRFAFGADVHEVWVEVPGARLHGLHLRNTAPRGLVFFLHGNAGNLDGWFSEAEFYRRLNLDLFMLDYRGYGKSGGRIASQAQLEADVRATWAQLAPHYTGLKRVIAGQSLGSALAAVLAAEVQPELTLLISPYDSMRALAAEHYRWVPLMLLRYPLDTAAALARVRGPVLLVHGDRDALIAPTHAERLARVAPQAELVIVRGAGHNDLPAFAPYYQAIEARLR